ncbi:MAG: hypothetical protein Kow0090_04390 [Myxococcota bacterium]
MERIKKIGAIIPLVLLVCACSSDAKEKDSGRITFKTEDGFTIVGTLIRAEKEEGSPAIVLAHQLRSNRSEWEALMGLLKKEGVTTLAIDLRGHGESTDKNGKKIEWKEFSDSDFQGMATDIKTAVKYLVENTKVDKAKIALIGSSIGGNSALRVLADDAKIRTVVALSPGLNYHSVTTEDAVKKVTDRDMYLIAASGDEYSTDSVNSLYEMNKARVTKEIISGSKHGVPMFDDKPELKNKVVNWFKERLK